MRVWSTSTHDDLSPGESQVYSLDCWRTYLFESSEPLRFPPGLAAEIPPFGEPPYNYQVNFGDYIGRFRLAGSEFRVTSSKLDEDGFEQLLQEISSRVAELPFDFNVPTFVPFEREAAWGEDLIYHALLYLRWARWCARPTLPELWASVAADPHRRLVRIERRARPWEVRAVSTRTIDQMLSEPHLWAPLPPDSPLASTALARTLGRGTGPCLPTEVVEPAVESTLDTPENRFLKYFLSLATELVDRCLGLLDKRGCLSALREDAITLAEDLRTMAADGFLKSVGELKQLPAASQVLQKRLGYREILSHYQALVLMSRYPFQAEDFSRIVEVKSASTLYEYWSFFEVAEILRQLVGRPTIAWKARGDGLRLGLEGALNIQFGRSLELSYNRTFSRSQTVSSSYSLPLRPDISLRIGDRLHLFDAKFRIEKWEMPDAKDVDAEEEAEERPLSPRVFYKTADIHKMHAYRDAIAERGASPQTVWILYPGTEFAFYDKYSGFKRDWAALGEKPQGVGAIPLSPRDRTDGLERVMRVLVG